MLEAIIFTPDKKPIKSGNIVLRGINDARNWISETAQYGDDVYVILENEVVVNRGIVEDVFDVEDEDDD